MRSAGFSPRAPGIGESGGVSEAALTDLAYYHEPYWHPTVGDRLKTLLLFFDGLAVLVPSYMDDAPVAADPALASPLLERGLLTVLRPEELVNERVTGDLVQLIGALIDAGTFDELDRDEAFQALSGSRLGTGPVAGAMSGRVEELLREQGLASSTEDDVSVPVHRVVRMTILGVLPQLFRTAVEDMGHALQPITPSRQQLGLLTAVLDQPGLPTSGRVVMSDLDQVTFDLASIPIEDILEFRAEHGMAHRAYARDLRHFVRTVATCDERDREQAWVDRREALADQADELRRLARTRWRRPMLSFGLGIAGSAVALATGNPVPAGITAASALVGLKRQSDPSTAYSYLFQAQREWQ